MTIDISPVTTSRTDSLAISYVYAEESRGVFEDCLSGASISSDVEISGSVDDNGGCITLRIRVRFGYGGECARCLDPVSGSQIRRSPKKRMRIMYPLRTGSLILTQ